MAHASRSCHRVCVQVARHRVVQRGPADAALGLPAERDPQPRRDRASDPVLPLRRLLGHGGHGIRLARTAHRTGGHRVVGGGDRQGGDADEQVSWDDLQSEAVVDRFDEYLDATEYTPSSRRIARVGQKIAKYHEPPAAVVEAAKWVHGELAYVPGTTGVHSSGLDAHREGKGVCQDFAHLTLDPVAQHGNSGSVRVGLPAPQQEGCRGRHHRRARATPGSRRGPVAGGTTTPPTTRASTSSTSASASAATTPT